MIALNILLLILAFVCLALAAIGVPPQPPPPRWNLMALGLAFWVLALLVGTGLR